MANYPAYFRFLRDRLKPQGRLLNHCITRPHNERTETGAFIDRYVFPDGELTGSGRIITEIQDVGLEVHHEENLRMHYAKTLAGWNANLVANWDACVAEVGEGTARVWGLYMAGSRMGFRSYAPAHDEWRLRWLTSSCSTTPWVSPRASRPSPTAFGPPGTS